MVFAPNRACGPLEVEPILGKASNLHGNLLPPGARHVERDAPAEVGRNISLLRGRRGRDAATSRGSCRTTGGDRQRPCGGDRPQVLVEHGVWQGSRLRAGGSWALLGCTVSPGFEF